MWTSLARESEGRAPGLRGWRSRPWAVRSAFSSWRAWAWVLPLTIRTRLRPFCGLLRLCGCYRRSLEAQEQALLCCGCSRNRGRRKRCERSVAVGRTRSKGEAMDHKRLEEGSELQLDFDKLAKVAQTGVPVLPVVVQDADTQGGADRRLCQPSRPSSTRSNTASPRSGAPRATSCGSRAPPRATRLQTRRGARQLRAELAALPGRAPGQGRLPYQGRRRQDARELLLSPHRRRRQLEFVD